MERLDRRQVTGAKRKRAAMEADAAPVDEAPAARRPRLEDGIEMAPRTSPFAASVVALLHADAAVPTSGVRLRPGGNQTRTYHRPSTSGAPGLADTGRWPERLYAHSAEVRTPRTFPDAEATRQAMRWTSTAIRRELLARTPRLAPGEVQGTVSSAGHPFIATNSSAANAALKVDTTGRSGREALDRIVPDAATIAAMPAGRERRHLSKLRTRVLAAAADRPKATKYAPFNAALDHPFRVATEGADGVHAERRFPVAMGEDVDPLRTGGIRRPCAACHLGLYHGRTDIDPASVHVGPMWPSRAALAGMHKLFDTPAALVAAFRAQPHTSVTAVAHGADTHATWDVDSDSESDEDV